MSRADEMRAFAVDCLRKQYHRPGVLCAACLYEGPAGLEGRAVVCNNLLKSDPTGRPPWRRATKAEVVSQSRRQCVWQMTLECGHGHRTPKPREAPAPKRARCVECGAKAPEAQP